MSKDCKCRGQHVCQLCLPTLRRRVEKLEKAVHLSEPEEPAPTPQVIEAPMLADIEPMSDREHLAREWIAACTHAETVCAECLTKLLGLYALEIREACGKTIEWGIPVLLKDARMTDLSGGDSGRQREIVRRLKILGRQVRDGRIRLPRVGEIWESKKCSVIPCCGRPLLIQGNIRPGVCECKKPKRPHDWGADHEFGPFEVTDPRWEHNGSGGWCWSRVACGCLVPRDDLTLSEAEK